MEKTDKTLRNTNLFIDKETYCYYHYYSISVKFPLRKRKEERTEKDLPENSLPPLTPLKEKDLPLPSSLAQLNSYSGGFTISNNKYKRPVTSLDLYPLSLHALVPLIRAILHRARARVGHFPFFFSIFLFFLPCRRLRLGLTTFNFFLEYWGIIDLPSRKLQTKPRRRL